MVRILIYIIIILLLVLILCQIDDQLICIDTGKNKPYPPYQKGFTDASRGFIATLDDPIIRNSAGHIVFDISQFDFIQPAQPHTVNQSLWHQANLLKSTGLFEVIPNKIYQIRGLDISNFTLVRCPDGWVMIDVLTSEETCTAGLQLCEKHLGKLNITHVIITHSHLDHFGGIHSVYKFISDKHNPKPKLIAPVDFIKESISENIYAGNAMSRRAMYMYGTNLPTDSTGTVTTGLGLGLSAGTYSIDDPDIIIRDKMQTINLSGLDFIFMYTPHAEAPTELMAYIPQYKALCASEILTQTMHNLYTLRGAQVRNGLIWSKYIDQILLLFGSDIEVCFASHQWPVWQNDQIRNFLIKQRDLYRFIHDQTLHYANQGFGPNQIVEIVKLPPSLNSEWFNRGYYGTLSHNIKGQYQYYLGWFDGNPANLNPLPDPLESAKWVELAGGPDQIYSQGLKAYKNRDYRWGATILNKLVMACPNHKLGRKLLADIYTVLGFQEENATWRNFYLTGATELINGVKKSNLNTVSADIIAKLDLDMLFDYVAIKLDVTNADTKHYKFMIELTDTNEKIYLELSNSTLIHRINYAEPQVDCQIIMTRTQLNEIITGKQTFKFLIQNQKIKFKGDIDKFANWLGMLVTFDPDFNIVTSN